VREGGQLIELCQGCAGRDGFRRETGGLLIIASHPRDEQSGSGIEDDDGAPWPVVSRENVANQHGVFRRPGAAQRFEGSAREAELLGSQSETPDSAVMHFGDQGFTERRDFVEPPSAMHNKSAANSEFHQRGGKEFQIIRRIDAEDLEIGGRRIRERAEKVENGAFADLFAGGNGVACGGMRCGGEQEADADVANGAAGYFDREIDAHAERFEDVGGATA